MTRNVKRRIERSQDQEMEQNSTRRRALMGRVAMRKVEKKKRSAKTNDHLILIIVLNLFNFAPVVILIGNL
jgi:hypothetical protein